MTHHQGHAAGDRIEALRQELFDRAERLLALAGGSNAGEIAAATERLAAAARPLFAAEEAGLRQAGSLTLERHAQEHARFLADLDHLADAALRGDLAAVAALRPASWITAWLAAHGRTDRDLATPARAGKSAA